MLFQHILKMVVEGRGKNMTSKMLSRNKNQSKNQKQEPNDNKINEKTPLCY